MVNRFEQNPIIKTTDIRPSHPDWKVECVLNPGVFIYENKIWLLLRVAERPEQKPGKISFPVLKPEGGYDILEFEKDDKNLDLSDVRMVGYKDKMYLSTISHLRLVCSEDGIHFYEPTDRDPCLFGEGMLETFGIEDCRVTKIGQRYYLTYTQVSENGVGVGMMHTTDWKEFVREGMILPPHNKDCAIFNEKINGLYYCLHRPSGLGLGGNYMWISSSPDLIHWGDHRCILHTRPGMWDAVRIGAGAAPIRTEEGWLEIYHGADANNRYCLGAVLLDLNDPTIVLSRSVTPLMEPDSVYEQTGFFGHVIFTNGHIVKGDEITMYYGASDEVICAATFSVQEILNSLAVSARF